MTRGLLESTVISVFVEKYVVDWKGIRLLTKLSDAEQCKIHHCSEAAEELALTHCTTKHRMCNITSCDMYMYEKPELYREAHTCIHVSSTLAFAYCLCECVINAPFIFTIRALLMRLN